jgi:hypothetical protein
MHGTVVMVLVVLLPLLVSMALRCCIQELDMVPLLPQISQQVEFIDVMHNHGRHLCSRATMKSNGIVLAKDMLDPGSEGPDLSA